MAGEDGLEEGELDEARGEGRGEMHPESNFVRAFLINRRLCFKRRDCAWQTSRFYARERDADGGDSGLGSPTKHWGGAIVNAN